MRVFFRIQFLIAALVAILAANDGGTASAHGFHLSLDGNKIVGDSGNVLFPDLFTRQLSASHFTDHGGLDWNDESGFGASDTFRFDIVGHLWFSDGGPASPAPSNVTLNVSSDEAPLGVNITGTSTSPAGFSIVNDSHSLEWQLSASGALPPGAYGLAYRVSGWANGVTPYVPSDPLILIFNTSNFTDTETLAAARTAVYQAIQAAAVPEPATFALAAVAALLGCFMFRRRRGGAFRRGPACRICLEANKVGATTIGEDSENG